MLGKDSKNANEDIDHINKAGWTYPPLSFQASHISACLLTIASF